MDDLKDMHRVFTDPRAMHYWDCLPHENIEQTRRWLAGMVALSEADTDDFVLEHEGRVIGKAGCWRPGEIGFILHSDHWGKGLAWEAMSAALAHIFATLPADRLKADVDPRNDASLRLLERLGFVEVGRAQRTIQVGGEWGDSVYLELRRPAWLSA